MIEKLNGKKTLTGASAGFAGMVSLAVYVYQETGSELLAVACLLIGVGLPAIGIGIGHKIEKNGLLAGGSALGRVVKKE